LSFEKWIFSFEKWILSFEKWILSFEKWIFRNGQPVPEYDHRRFVAITST
jgi:hypothetical protein